MPTEDKDVMDRACDDLRVAFDELMREIARGAIWLALIQEDFISDWWRPGA